MRKIFSVCLYIILIVNTMMFTSCKKAKVSLNPTCFETPPTELCDAVFFRWFYNSNTNQCILEEYSGCSPKGFETKAACMKCTCR